MHKLPKTLLTLVAVGMVSVVGLNLATSKTSLAIGRTSKTAFRSLFPGKDYIKSTAERLADLFRRRPGRGGSHGEFCSITPNPTNGHFRTSWSTQPLFAWRGDVVGLEVLDVAAGNTSIWTHQLTDAENRQQYAIYSGSNPLVRGERYKLIVEYRDPTRPNAPASKKDIRFEILRNAPTIDARLAEIGDPNTASDIVARQDMVLQRAEIFAEPGHSLWMDIMREVAPIDDRGAWSARVKTTMDEMCE